jgi:hypothetical protein
VKGRLWLAIASGVAASVLVLLLGLFMPMEIRHSATYGFSKTIDFDRAIAVDGGYVTANYGNFNRLDLDLRAYTPGTTYDLTIHIRPAGAGAAEVRTIPLSVTSDEVFNRKRAFDNPFTTVHFPPIRDSAGKTYYIWLDHGPRNRDDVIALWSIKSYSRESGSAVVGAFLDGLPGGRGGWIIKTGVVAALLIFVAMVGVLVGTVVYVAARLLAPPPGQHENLMTA